MRETYALPVFSTCFARLNLESSDEVDTMIFFFTDNSTVEGALYKGTSASPKLIDLVVRFNALQAHYDAQIIVSHVSASGKRMIAQGADGLSGGAENDGAMGGQDIMEFIPLHQSPLERSPWCWPCPGARARSGPCPL